MRVHLVQTSCDLWGGLVSRLVTDGSTDTGARRRPTRRLALIRAVRDRGRLRVAEALLIFLLLPPPSHLTPPPVLTSGPARGREGSAWQTPPPAHLARGLCRLTAHPAQETEHRRQASTQVIVLNMGTREDDGLRACRSETKGAGPHVTRNLQHIVEERPVEQIEGVEGGSTVLGVESKPLMCTQECTYFCSWSFLSFFFSLKVYLFERDSKRA